MKGYSALFVGCGDLGIRAGNLLAARDWQVAGVRRDISGLPANVAGYAADYTTPHSLEFIAALKPDYVVATFTPIDRTPEGYQAGFGKAMTNLLAGLGKHRPRYIVAASSTRVFAETGGGWVNENSPLSTEDPQAGIMVQAEQQLLNSGLDASVVRFAGLYGAPGGRLLSRVATGELCRQEPPRYSNRMHRDDAAGFLAHLLRRASTGAALAPVYIGVDDQPVLQYEVESWLAGEMAKTASGARPPSRVDDQLAAPATVSHKRCSNKGLHDSGYQLRYPGYQSGYTAVLAS